MGRVHPLAICALALVALPFGLAQAGLTLTTATDVVIFAIACMGLNILVGQTGLVSFGHGAWFGLGALTADDAVYPSAFVDGDGKPLDGASKYVLHVEKEQMFPSHSGVWSVSVYAGNFYVCNAIDR